MAKKNQESRVAVRNDKLKKKVGAKTQPKPPAPAVTVRPPFVCVCGFCGKKSNVKEPELWGERDPEGYPVGPACYDCYDVHGVIRPGAVTGESLKSYKNPRASDETLTSDFDTAKENLAEKQASPNLFRPGVSVDLRCVYGYTVSQNYALVTAEEFEAFAGLDPETAGAEAVDLPWHGPGAPNSDLFLLGLEGMRPDQALGVRTVKLKFSRGTVRMDNYLCPADQLLEDQGDRMFTHVAGLINKVGSGAEKLNTQVTVKSVGDLRHEASLAKQQQEEAEAHWRQTAELMESGLADNDSADELMKKDGGPQADGSADTTRIVKRRAGLGSGMLRPAAAPKQPPPKKLRKPSAEATPSGELEVLQQGSGMPAEEMLRLKGPEKAESEHGRSSKTGTKPASSGNAGGGCEDMDADMQAVAEHCGGNVKSLIGLVCERFLEYSPDAHRYALSAKIRGANQIKDKLLTEGFRNAADTLAERIDACQSCDVLASKDLRHMKTDDVRKLVTLSKEAWEKYPLPVKSKLVQHRILHVHMVNVARSSGIAMPSDARGGAKETGEQRPPPPVLSAVEAMTTLAESLQLVLADGVEDAPKFSVWTPALPSLVKDLVSAVRSKLKQLGVLADSSEPDLPDLVLDITQAKAKSAQMDASAVQQALMAETAVAQAMAETVVAALSCDIFSDVLRKGLQSKSAVIAFAKVLLDGKIAMESEMREDNIVWTSSALAPLVDLSNRLETIARFFCHIFCVQLPAGMRDTTDADVNIIVHYAGRNLFEKGIQRIINDPDSWWKKEVDDMVKTGAGSVLASLKMDQLEEWLREDGPWSWQTLASATQAFAEVSGSCRSQKLGPMQDDFVAKVLATGKRWMASNKDEEISSRHADCMLAALATVIDCPEVRETQQKVKTWMAERQQQVATNDLLQILNTAPGSPVNPQKLQVCIKNCGAWPESAVELLPAFMKTLIQDTVAKVSGLEPKQSQIRENLALMRELVGKMPDGDRAVCLKRFVSCWTEIVTAGSVLLSGNLTVRKSEDDFATFFKQQGLETLNTLAQQRQRITQADKSLEKMEEELTTVGLASLVTMRLPESIQSELSAQSFDDAVSYQAAAHVRYLEDLIQQRVDLHRERLESKISEDANIDVSKDYFHALWVKGSEPWHKHLPPQGNWEDIYRVAKEYILKYLSATSINTFVDCFKKVSPRVVEFLQTFGKEVVSDGAQSALTDLQGIHDKAARDCLIAEAYRIEIFLSKGIRQYGVGDRTNNDQDKSMAKTQVQKQLTLITSDNPCPVLEEHIAPLIVQLAREITG